MERQPRRASIGVEYDDHMGSDLSVVNAARTSFGKRSTWASPSAQVLRPADAGLIRFLASGMSSTDLAAEIFEILQAESDEVAMDIIDHLSSLQKHFAPFTHPHVSFRVQAPIFVARQLLRSTVGLAVSEVSRRYVKGEPEFMQLSFREAPENKKQGSGKGVGGGTQYAIDIAFRAVEAAALKAYEESILAGVAPEQARAILPQTMMTTWVWTGSLYAFARICLLRLDSHAQQESREVARGISGHMARLFPVSWAALVPAARKTEAA